VSTWKFAATYGLAWKGDNSVSKPCGINKMTGEIDAMIVDKQQHVEAASSRRL
jgi:hypothetical protein